MMILIMLCNTTELQSVITTTTTTELRTSGSELVGVSVIRWT